MALSSVARAARPDRERPKHVADEAGRSWLEALQAARTSTERKREANAQLLEAWGVGQEQDSTPGV
jgi:hypothetical protein